MLNGKPVIGIMPTSVYMKDDNPSNDYCSYTNTYVETILECGGIPYFIPLAGEKVIPDAMEMMDGLFLPGGLFVKEVNFEIIQYAYDRKLPILGVCLGMQEIGMFSVRLYDKEKRNLVPIETGVNHRPREITRAEKDFYVHSIHVEHDSILYRLFNKDDMMVNSLHRRTVTFIGPDFKITAKSPDGLIEGIEYIKDDRYIHGVQFHPELIRELYPVYRDFIEKCRK
ncbi:MAG: gamma-glutamyl-gamma-aminobutyrate hydrolase family protein [Clostridia bacterium]|nr:gamma-glutamyl-gamma-aminobutyrate hydrolase family protein [Clostridia bacterium]